MRIGRADESYFSFVHKKTKPVFSGMIVGMSLFKKLLGQEPEVSYPNVNDLVSDWVARSESRVRQINAPGITEGYLVRLLTVLRKRELGVLIDSELLWQPQEDREAIVAVCSHPLLPVPVMENIFRGGHIGECLGLASNPSCPPGLLLRLREPRFGKIREAVLDNPNIPVAGLKVFRGDTIRVRVKLAAHNHTPSDVLESLGDDEKPQVLAAVAANTFTPLPVLLRLGEEEPSLRLIVAANPTVSVSAATDFVQSWLDGFADHNPGWIKGRVLEGLMGVRVPVLVKLMQPVIPEITDMMPREWLLNLWGAVGRS